MRKLKSTAISLVVTSALSLGLTGCNTASHEVQPTYVSSYKYENKSCESLKRELSYLQDRASRMANRVDQLKDSQDTKLGWGWVWWPSYIIFDDNKQEVKELSRLRGEHKAVTISMEAKKCGEL